MSRKAVCNRPSSVLVTSETVFEKHLALKWPFLLHLLQAGVLIIPTSCTLCSGLASPSPTIGVLWLHSVSTWLLILGIYTSSVCPSSDAFQCATGSVRRFELFPLFSHCGFLSYHDLGLFQGKCRVCLHLFRQA